MSEARPAPSVSQLLAIIELQNEIASSQNDLERVMRTVVDRAGALTKADGAVVELVEGEEMVYRAVSGTVSHSLGLRLSRKKSLSGLCVEQGIVLRSDDAENDERVDPVARRHVGIASMVCAPLFYEGSVVGVLKLVSSKSHVFTDADVALVELLARIIAASIHHARAHEEALHDSLHDGLTGLLNRRAFEAQLREEVARNRRFGEGLCLMMLDLDGFKQANDRWGHGAGDEILQRTAELLRSTSRTFDNCFRLGGDEFAILMPGTRLPEARSIAARVKEAVAAAALADGTITISAGVSEQVNESPPELVDVADAALYADKRAGRTSSGRPIK